MFLQRSFIVIKSFKSPIKWGTTTSPILIVRIFSSLTLNTVHFQFGTAQMEGTAQNVDKLRKPSSTKMLFSPKLSDLNRFLSDKTINRKDTVKKM